MVSTWLQCVSMCAGCMQQGTRLILDAATLAFVQFSCWSRARRTQAGALVPFEGVIAALYSSSAALADALLVSALLDSVVS